jgi:hypothetical protein
LDIYPTRGEPALIYVNHHPHIWHWICSPRLNSIAHNTAAALANLTCVTRAAYDLPLFLLHQALTAPRWRDQRRHID